MQTIASTYGPQQHMHQSADNRVPHQQIFYNHARHHLEHQKGENR